MFTAEAMTALVTLSVMEIILGIDNIIFIAVLTNRLPKDQQGKARTLGITFALLSRITLLFSISWVMSLTKPIGALFDHTFSAKDLILLGGGLFLIAKATKEIHDKVEHIQSDLPLDDLEPTPGKKLFFIISQIMLLDIIFSLDSVITAVGMAKDLWVMVTAMVIAMVVMIASVRTISDFVEKHPTVKILALSFLILIGVFLTLEGMGAHINKNYIYFAIFFSLSVELVNLRYRTKRKKA